MAFLHSFGHYVPSRTLDNSALAADLGVAPEWMKDASGIEARRLASPDETVASMGAQAARNCLTNAGIEHTELGMILVSSGSGPRRFPGPAAEIASALGLDQTPALDLPIASAGSLAALVLANSLAPSHGPILVVASEKMSEVALREPLDKNIAILFGDGAGACLVTPSQGRFEVKETALHTDGAFAADLALPLAGPLYMNGRSVILQASRKIPSAIREVLERAATPPEAVEVFLMHQANQNLIDRVAKALGVLTTRFYSNIARYGNTSSASMLIAASEWSSANRGPLSAPVCFAAFGAGFTWGAILTN